MVMQSLKVTELFEAARTAIRPPSDLSPPDWAGEFVRVQNSERSPFFDIEQTPWWRRPMEAAGDNEVRQIVVLAPTGSGKSTMAEGLIPWIVSEDPGPLLYASQTDDDAKFWAESRLLPTLKACEPLKGLWPDDRHKSRKMEIIWPHMPMVLGGANMSNFQEKSVRWLYGDEVWKWAPGLVREFLARHHNRWNRRVFLVSQGGVGDVGARDTDKDDELTQEWKKTDQADFSWRCRGCDSVQAYDGGQIVMDDVKRDGELDMQATADTARLVCPVCGEEYRDTVAERRGLAEGAVYVPKAEGLRGYIGCHVHALAVWWVPWSEYGLEKLQAMAQLKAGLAERYRALVQKRDAWPWKEDMADQRAALQVGGYQVADYANGTPIEDEARRFLTVDVGKDHYWAVVRAWRSGGESVLLWEGYVPSDDRLREIQCDYQVEASHVFIDIGFDSGRIYDLCAGYGWTGIKGDKAKGFRHPRRKGQVVERLFSTIHRTRAPGGGVAKYLLISADGCKNILHRLRHGQGARWEVPADVSAAYRNQIDSETRRTFRNARTGQEEEKWVKVRRANHLFDCENYQVAGALVFDLFESGDG